MPSSRSLAKLERHSNDTSRKRFQRALSSRASLKQSRDSLIMVSRMLVLESKLLLLHRAQRKFLVTQTEGDLKAVDDRHGQVRQAEAAVRSREGEPFALRSSEYSIRVYTSLVTRAVNTRGLLSRICADLPPDQRFQTAANIQMLEELIAQWKAATRTIKRRMPVGRRARKTA